MGDGVSYTTVQPVAHSSEAGPIQYVADQLPVTYIPKHTCTHNIIVSGTFSSSPLLYIV